MSKRYTKEEIEELLKIHYPEVSIDFSTYTFTKTKCRFVDEEYGEFWMKPRLIWSIGAKHPQRSRAKTSARCRLKIEEIQKRLLEKYGDILTIDALTYTHGRAKARFIDRDFGEFWSRPDSVLNSGHRHPQRARKVSSKLLSLPVEEVKERLKQVWGDEITIKEESYTSIHQTAIFVHKTHGEWRTSVGNVLAGHGHKNDSVKKARKTMKKRHGVEHYTESEEMFRNARINLTQRVIVPHWKTGKTIHCTASFEYAVVKKLNEIKADFDWQIKFRLDIDGKMRTYYCDLYLKDDDKYVEIKGYFINEISKIKWEKFSCLHPNSELWMQKEVVRFTGISIREIREQFKNALAKANLSDG